MAAVTGAVRVVLAGLVATLVLAVVRALARHVVLAVVLLALVLWYIDGLSRFETRVPDGVLISARVATQSLLQPPQSRSCVHFALHL